ncbi:MAG TPA: KUP/HAK/KT family potassium transporter [Steroidobacteraceae bacterium]|jgi:KUP system potassium uptake protein|nr:KUP/HAK/KT family potassium transporter [Steroidobacteraceae bacterium]
MHDSRRWSLPAVIGAIGIVYGDIGTSPLYAFETALNAAGAFDPSVVLGVLSLIFWSLMLSVTFKYVTIMMRADNQGEGGILALFALAQRNSDAARGWFKWLVGLALAGTAFFFCDALITPAISVLSAVEGLELLDPEFEGAVIPVTIIVLALLFLIQKRGTARVGRLFGPVMIVWFLAIAVTGASAIRLHPSVLVAVDPRYGIMLLMTHPVTGLAILGGVFLALTGGEALYADMGHFGKTPVRIAWLALVWPSLILNYFGQGAMLLDKGGMIPHPLYALVPPALLPWMLILATAATVIASQAVISGAFSVARQAVQLDLLPRIRVLQTSALEQGQIYVPVVNMLQFLAVVAFVLGFRSSDALSGAYGAAVVGTMFITNILGGFVAATQWHWPRWAVFAVFVPLLAMDSVFLAGNLTKLQTGGWIPLTLSAILCFVFWTWRSGRLDLREALAKMAVQRKDLAKLIDGAIRVPGTGVFLASDRNLVPSALIRNIEHNRVVHERVIILNIEIAHTPRQDPVRRVDIEEILPGVYEITARFGFMETPDVAQAMKSCRTRGMRVFSEDSSFFVGRHLVRARPRPGFKGLQRRFFAAMQSHSTQAAEFFRMPYKGVIVLNTAVEI